MVSTLTTSDGTLVTAVVMSSWSPAVVSEPIDPAKTIPAITTSVPIRRSTSENGRVRAGSTRSSISTSAADHPDPACSGTREGAGNMGSSMADVGGLDVGRSRWASATVRSGRNGGRS